MKIFKGITKNGVVADLCIKDNSFYIKFNYNGLEEVRKIFEINDSNMNVLETIGNHELDKYLKEKEREHYVLLFNAEKYTNNSGGD